MSVRRIPSPVPKRTPAPAETQDNQPAGVPDELRHNLMKIEEGLFPIMNEASGFAALLDSLSGAAAEGVPIHEAVFHALRPMAARLSANLVEVHKLASATYHIAANEQKGGAV